MKVKLKDISKILFGPYLKGGTFGDVKYLLASHFDSYYKPSKFELSFVKENEVSNEQFLKDGDVILTGKGQRIFAWAYEKSMGLCVPSSLFFVLTPSAKNISSEYLAYYLNSDPIQHKLKILSSGLTIPSISKKELQNLDIVIPSLSEQKKFVELKKLMEEEEMLVKKILEKKKYMNKTVINNMITKYNKDV